MKRLEAFQSLADHAWYRSLFAKLNDNEKRLAHEFIATHEALPLLEFEYKINQMFLGHKAQPKSAGIIMELLMAANTIANPRQPKPLGTIALCFLVLLTACSCGHQTDLGEFAEYAHKFQEEGTKRGVTVDLTGVVIKRGTTELPQVAKCETDAFGKKEIVVMDTLEPAPYKLSMETWIFHELGHCVLGRSHRDDTNEKGRAISLMNKNAPQALYPFHRDEYLDELFKN